MRPINAADRCFCRYEKVYDMQHSNPRFVCTHVCSACKEDRVGPVVHVTFEKPNA